MAKTKKAEVASSSTSTSLDQISNFHILPIHMPALTSTSSAYKNIIHYLYFKKHESPKADPKTPKDRTLFVLNVPVDATEDHFRDLFKPYGRIAAVHFISRIRDTSLTKEEREHQEELERLEREALAEEEANTGKKGAKKGKKNAKVEDHHHHHHRTLYASGSHAYVVFLEEQELAKALTMKRKKRSWIDSGSEDTKLTSLGVSKWIQEYHHKRPAPAALQTKVDDYMDKFERSEYEAEQAALARHNVMDEDGFTLVTSAKGTKGANSDGVISIKAVKAEDVKHIKPKKKELQDFYRFQMREAKRDKLVDLRRKFEEDKIRIEALKVNRRFKPY
ncbi:Ribosomal RNA-processing protein 7 [Podila verticillata]|nr:Ribosomal RNA-processing protein 7 [Podila verticillata]